MTIAISLKVHDGIVLAADSASTMIVTDQSGRSVGVINVYNNANKVFNLYKGLPLGGMTWGVGSIGHASIATLIKDLRKRFMGKTPNYNDWILDKQSYTIENVATLTKKFLFNELYDQVYKKIAKKDRPNLGFRIVGYSANEDLPEVWKIDISKGDCSGPVCIRSGEDIGIDWSGEIEAIHRLIIGYGTGLTQVLKELGVPKEEIITALKHISSRLQIPFAPAPMPIQDAIDLAEFLASLTVNFSRFMPGPPTVGGPIEIAAITKHEGFNWVSRKFYYEAKYNPRSEK